ncbi:MAG: SDR family NAD-dependent epimerase/dehydratase, partial [Cytophagales bacterium]
PPDIYNLAEYNFSINHIVNELKKIYPDLEYIFVNQNIRMRDVLIDENEKQLLDLIKEKKNFLEELKDFKSSFSF